MAPAFINMVRQFHDRMMAHVLDNGKISRDLLVWHETGICCRTNPPLNDVVSNALICIFTR